MSWLQQQVRQRWAAAQRLLHCLRRQAPQDLLQLLQLLVLQRVVLLWLCWRRRVVLVRLSGLHLRVGLCSSVCNW